MSATRRPSSPDPRDEDTLEPDPRAPAPLQDFADELARRVGERDVDDEEDGPDGLRDLERAGVLGSWGSEIRLGVQRRDDAEHHGEDRSDEHAEEVVDARTPPPEAIETLQLKAERHDDRDEGQDVDILPQRWNAFRDRDDAGVKTESVRQDERRHGDECVREEIQRDEEAVMPTQHGSTLPSHHQTASG